MADKVSQLLKVKDDFEGKNRGRIKQSMWYSKV